MDLIFQYDCESPRATEYVLWLESMQEKADRRRTAFAVTAACIFSCGIIWAVISCAAGLHPVVGIVPPLFTTILAMVCMTDGCRGSRFFDPVGAVIHDFDRMNEFDIGKYEFTSHDVEIQKLLYCLRITSNLRKYKKIDVILSRWQLVVAHGGPYFDRNPRGRFVFDFMLQIYIFHAYRVLSEFVSVQRTVISKLKTDKARQNRITTAKEKLTGILAQNGSFPHISELVNDAVASISEPVESKLNP